MDFYYVSNGEPLIGWFLVWFVWWASSIGLSLVLLGAMLELTSRARRPDQPAEPTQLTVIDGGR